MTPDHPAPVPPPAAPSINYVKLTLSLMVVVVFWHFIEHWPDVKAGFLDGYRNTYHRSSR